MNTIFETKDDDFIPAPLDVMVNAIQMEPVPDEAIERVIAKAKQLAVHDMHRITRPAPSLARRPQAVRTSFSWMTAVAAVVMAGVVFLTQQSTSIAFADMISKVKAASSVRFTLVTKFGDRPAMAGSVILSGNKMRIEQADGLLVQIGDFDARSALFLNTKQRISQTVELTSKVAESFINPIDQLKNAKSTDASEVGEEILNGRRTRIYRLRQIQLLGMKGPGEMLIWVDRESQLPARITTHDPDPKAETEIRFENFVWDKTVDESKFALTAPAGYSTGTVVTSPESDASSASKAAATVAPVLAENLIEDRVPGRIVWSRDAHAVLALMRDPETAKPEQFRARQLRSFELSTGKLIWSHDVAGSSDFAMSTDGRLLANVIGREIQLRQLETGKIVKTWTTKERLTPLSFSPDGKTLAAGITEWGQFGGRGGKPSGGVEVWDLERGTLMNTYSDDQPTTFLTYTPDGRFIATSSNDGPVKLLSATTGEIVRIFPGRGDMVLSSDGQSMACIKSTVGNSVKVGQVDLYRVSDGSLIRSMTTEAGSSSSHLLRLSISQDGHLIAAADWNGAVTVWKISSGERLQTMNDHKGGVVAIQFSPDGQILASGSEDQTLRLSKIVK